MKTVLVITPGDIITYAFLAFFALFLLYVFAATVFDGWRRSFYRWKRKRNPQNDDK